MSRQLDFSNLSEEDKIWLRSWDRADEIPADQPSTKVDKVADLPVDRTEDDYDAWKVAELRDALKEAGLSTDGHKADLIARLREADAKGL